MFDLFPSILSLEKGRLEESCKILTFSPVPALGTYCNEHPGPISASIANEYGSLPLLAKSYGVGNMSHKESSMSGRDWRIFHLSLASDPDTHT